MSRGIAGQIAILAGVAAGTVLLAGCQSKSTVTGWQANGTPVHSDPNEPWWNYELIYHPNSGVYFEPYSHTWHWQENGEWRSSNVRPGPVAWRADEAVVVKLNWDTPEYGHTSVAMMHPATERASWSRTFPVTAPAALSTNSAMAKKNDMPAEPAEDDDTISLGPTPNKLATSEAHPSSSDHQPSGTSSSASSAVAGVTDPSHPE